MIFRGIARCYKVKYYHNSGLTEKVIKLLEEMRSNNCSSFFDGASFHK